METNKKLKINVIFNYIYEIFLIAVPLISAPYASRVLEPDGVGIVSYSRSLVTYFTLFAMLGVSSYGLRKIAVHRENKEEYSKQFWGIECVTIISSVIALLFWSILVLFYKEYSLYLLILSLEIINVVFNISWFYKGLEEYKYIVVLNIVVKLLSLVLLFTLVKEKDDLPIYVLTTVGSTFLGSLSMWFFLPRFVLKQKISLKDIKEHFKETFAYFVPSIAISIYTVLDKTLIGVLTNNNFESGYYEQATKIIDICKTVCFLSLNGVMISRMSFLYGKNDIDNIKKSIKTTMNITLCLSIGATFGLIAISDIFVPFYFGDGYDSVIILLKLLSIIIPIICVSNVLGNLYYTPIGKIKTSTIFLIIGSLINFSLNIPLIIFFNSVGAVVSSLIAELVISILFFVNCRNILTFFDLLKIIWKKAASGIFMLICLNVFNYFVSPNLNIILLLFIDCVLGLLIYIAILFLLKDSSILDFMNFFKNDDKEIVANEV